MHDEICREGYVRGLGHFVAYFGSESLDASLLLLPLLGFLPVEDERIAQRRHRARLTAPLPSSQFIELGGLS